MDGDFERRCVAFSFLEVCNKFCLLLFCFQNFLEGWKHQHGAARSALLVFVRMAVALRHLHPGLRPWALWLCGRPLPPFQAWACESAPGAELCFGLFSIKRVLLKWSFSAKERFGEWRCLSEA